MPSDKIPRKRIRDSDSASDTDDAGPGIEQRRLPNTAYLDTPPPSSPARAQRSSLGDQRTRSRPLANVTLDPVNLNDFELLTLSSAPYEGPVTGIQDWLKSEFDNIVQEEGGDASAIRSMGANARQLKPPPYTPNALVRPVTGTEWSVRLWPASELHWCLDFVHTVTHAPKNKPFEFELWAVPLADPTLNTAPWLPLDTKERRSSSVHGSQPLPCGDC